jgi:uncharacterized protein (TIGR02271 family)
MNRISKAAARGADRKQGMPEANIPVFVEELDVTKQTEITGALRVRIEVDRHDATVHTNETSDAVSVQRVARGVSVEATREPWTEGETLVVPVYEERVVIERHLILKEEVRLTRRTERSAVDVQATVREERAAVERQQPDGSWKPIDVARAPAASAGPRDAPATGSTNTSPRA